MRMFSRNLALAVLTIASGLFFGQIAKADGVEPGYKDIRPSYRHQNSAAHLREYLTPEEKRLLKRIHAKASARREGRVARRSRLVERIYVAQPRRPRYVETVRYERDTRECKAPIEVTGHERLGRARAAQSARNAWRTTTSDRHGYRFANLELARGEDLDCTKVRGNTFAVYVCALRARPCKDL